jgi:hypothetical protein
MAGASCRVFAGDMIRGLGQYEQEKAELFLRFFSATSYDAVAPGEMDLALGAAFWRQEAKDLPFLVCANVYDAQRGKLLFSPWLLKKVRLKTGGTVRVAITGVLAAEYWPPVGLQREKQVEVALRDHVEALRQVVPEMRRKADMVVVLAHVGDVKAKELAQAFPDIDLIVAGHTSGVSVLQPAEARGTLVVSNGYAGKFDGQMVFRFDEKMKLTGHQPKQTALSDSVPEDPEIGRIVREFKGKWTAQPFSAAVPPASEPFFAGALTCQKCHGSQYEQWRKTPHARALTALVKSEGGKDAKNPECLRCHTLGFGKPQGFTSTNQLSPFLYGSVQCEHCHGAASGHIRQPAEKGKIVRRPLESVCISCHDKKQDPRFNYSKKLPSVRH